MNRAFLLLPCLLAAAACTSVSYQDPERVETVNIDFGSTDLQVLASEMTESMLRSQAFSTVQRAVDRGGDERVVAVMGGVQNRTSEHIDTHGITDSIRTKLVKSGAVRFVTGQAGQAEIEDQVRFQQGSGRVDPLQAAHFGRQLGADLVVYGTLRSIDKEGRDVWYQFVLQAVNVETAEIVWAEEQNLRKVQKRGLFG